MKGRRISFLDYEKGSALLTNTLGFVSSRVTLLGNVTLHNMPSLRKMQPQHYDFQETLFISAAPSLLSLADLDIPHRDFQTSGFLIQAFRDSKKRPVFFLRHLAHTTRVHHSEIHREPFWAQKGMYCSHPYVNQSLSFNLTLDFTAGQMSFTLNDTPCISHPIDPIVFPSHRVFFSLFASGTFSDPFSIFIDRLSIFKRIELSSAFDQQFDYSMHRLSHHAHTRDLHYRRNVSLANTFINSVNSSDSLSL